MQQKKHATTGFRFMVLTESGTVRPEVILTWSLFARSGDETRIDSDGFVMAGKISGILSAETTFTRRTISARLKKVDPVGITKYKVRASTKKIRTSG